MWGPLPLRVREEACFPRELSNAATLLCKRRSWFSVATRCDRGAPLRVIRGGAGDVAFLCFDYQGLVNAPPTAGMSNVRAQWRLGEGISQFVALRDIWAGEELFQSYDSADQLS